MKAQIIASREAMVRTGKKVPIQCSITLDPTGRMLLGTDYRGALATLEAMHVDIIGSTARRVPTSCATPCATCARTRARSST